MDLLRLKLYETVTGGYWERAGTPARANKNAYNCETQKRLWDAK